MMQDPQKNPDRNQSLIDSSLGHAHLSANFHQNLFITFGDILFTRNDYTQGHIHTQLFNQPRSCQKHG